MEDAVTCAVCSEVYVTGARDPLVLPCGHTLCRACVTSVKNAATEKPLSCPICRTCHPFLSIYSLPVNFSLLSLSTTYLENQVEHCAEHGEPLTYWCRHCRTEVCGLCILTGHLRDGHSVVTTATLLEEKKEGFGSDAATVIHEARELHQKTSSHFKTALVRLMCLSVANESLLEMEDTVTTLQEKVQKAKNIDHVLMHEAHLKELLPTQKITNLLSETNISESRVPISTTRECLNVLPMPVTASVMHDPDNDTSNRSGCSAPSTNTNMSLRESFVASGFMEQSQPRTGGGTGLGGLSCRVHMGDGRHAHLAWQDDHLLLYALAAAGPDPQVLIQFSALEGLLESDRPVVFLELSAGGLHLGRVYIRLRGHMRRAQQFLALCLGTLGASFVGSFFSRVNDKGEPGETLVGGKYYCQREKRFVAKGLIDSLEWGGEHGDADKAGYLADYSDGNSKHDTLFGICTSDNLGMDLVIPVFGEVTAGLEVVSAAASHQPVTDVTIIQSGLVIPTRPLQDPLCSGMDSLSLG
ncbi:uncharacterized protein LOC119596212 [Penaeus monodon]|uniref:uncharacterized protein LOC119596212 n=1 Tax=Penaeus monodon TaxID=6687 RepID=UPI0018A77D81|nr:uncharacterized protein LOC119596212 [Penaeus monodon]